MTNDVSKEIHRIIAAENIKPKVLKELWGCTKGQVSNIMTGLSPGTGKQLLKLMQVYNYKIIKGNDQ
jgi:hypothetical protein